jgi:Uma2 family endonuclease
MVELKIGPRTVDIPYSVHLPDVTEEMFDALVDEDTRAELIDGVMIVHSPASPGHEDLSGFLRGLMRFYARARKLGIVLGPDALIRLKKGRKVAPDTFFLRQGLVPRPLPLKEFDDVPDMIVEVLSPSNRDDDLEIKRPRYQEAGVEEIWFVDPQREEILVDRRRKKRYASTTVTEGRLTATALEGFWIDTAWLWADELPDDLTCLREILGDLG